MQNQIDTDTLAEEREKLVFNYLEAHENPTLDTAEAARALALFDEQHPNLKG